MEKQTVKRIDLSNVKTGDKLIRLIGNQIPMPVVVGEMDDTYIWVGSVVSAGGLSVPATKEKGWKFLKKYGTEVDEDLGMDGINVTGSILRPWDQSVLDALDMHSMFEQDINKKK